MNVRASPIAAMPQALSTASPSSRSSVVTATELADLAAIFAATTNVVVYRRALAPELRVDVSRALEGPPLRVTTALDPTSDPDALAPQLPGLPALAADVLRWCEVLQELTGCASVGVRLARLTSAMCPRMHVDKVQVRLVSTYAGAGTELLAHEDADRRFLGHAARGAPDERSGLLRPGAHVRSAATGDVVLLKGEAWPGNAGRGAVHRSPAASEDAPRIVLTLDPL